MTIYRYIFGSLRTENVIDEIPLYGTFMDMQLNNGGQFQGTFQLDQTGKDNATMMSATIPGKTWVTCERNGIAVWHGFIWSRVYSAQSKSVQLFAWSFEKYATKRLIRQDISYDDYEQRNIMRELWLQMQAVTGGNMNVNVPGAFVDANLKDLEVLATDFKYYDEVISSLADTFDGFDWYISVTKDGVNYRKDLLIGYPALGVVQSPGMVVFEYPGNITQYYMTESMSEAGTNIFIIGSGEGDTMIVGEYDNSTAITNGFPRWDIDISRKDITSQSSVDSLAQQEAIVRYPPMSIIKIYVKANVSPEFGSYNLGDTCRVVIRDPRNPDNGFNGYKRLVKWELHPQTSENTEEAYLIFEGDPDVQ